jgi:hypothetical protein
LVDVAGVTGCAGAVEVHPARISVSARSPHTILVRIMAVRACRIVFMIVPSVFLNRV